ncbi:MAG: hypothetical protein LBS73_01670 [Campylobacteraceae bacterium]|jgi:hypothetical protein|nr:hypothetical protein [Campylobacteraceae bacterium]
MRRDITYNRHLKLTFLALFLFTYQIFAGVYAFLSPLAGFFFVYIVKNFKKEDMEIYLAFLYLCFFELNQGFYLFSMVFLFVIFYYLIKPRLVSMFESEAWIISITVISAYVGLYAVNLFFAYFLNQPFSRFSVVYIFYILIDIVLASLFLRSKS